MLNFLKSKQKFCFIIGFFQLFSSLTILLGSAIEAEQITDPIDHQKLLKQNMVDNIVAKAQAVDHLEISEAGSPMKDSLLKLQLEGYTNFITAFLNKGNQEERHSSVTALPHDQKIWNFMQKVSDISNNMFSQACSNDTSRLLLAIMEREKWAIPFVDSMGKPGPSLALHRYNFVGNYKQCRSGIAQDGGLRKFKGNYCVIGAVPKISASALTELELGACAPDTCSLKDLWLFVKAVIQIANMSSSLEPTMPDCHTDEREVTTATVMSIIVLATIGSMMFLGTIYDLLVVQQVFRTNDEVLHDKAINHKMPNGNPEIGEPNGIVESSETTALVEKSNERMSRETGVFAKILLAFSVYTNGKKVLNTSQPPGSLSAVHGIRFLSMSWVVLAHVYAFILNFSENTLELMPFWLDRWTFDAIVNGYPSVDTFFTLSGLLTSYLTIKEMMKQSWKINWPLFYFHRFWRLTPPYMLSLLLVLGLQRFLGSGALWATVQPGDKTFCENNWWTNLLYVNNLVKPKEMCFGHSWYLANDMQFFVVSPLMLIPFYFHRLAGFASCGLFLLVSWITTGVLSTKHKWPATNISMKPQPGAATWFNDYYITPWCRIGPFVVGVMAGYILAATNGGKNLRMKWWMVLLGWVVAIASGLAVVYGLHGDISGSHVSSVSVAALYNTWNRSVWGACVSWVIIACASGYGGPVNALLSWSPFVFLSKLTYMSYLIHLCLGGSYFQNAEVLFHIDETNMTVIYLGLLVIVNMVAFVLMLGLESPMIGLERAFLRKGRRN